MKHASLGDADGMTFAAITDALKRELEEKYPDELDTHFVPSPDIHSSSKKKTKSRSKVKAGSTKNPRGKTSTLSKETVEGSDLDDEDNADNIDLDATPHEIADSTTNNNGYPDRSATPDLASANEASNFVTEPETDSYPASSAGAPDTDHDAEVEVPDSDGNGDGGSRTLEGNEEEEDEDEDVDKDVDMDGDGTMDVEL